MTLSLSSKITSKLENEQTFYLLKTQPVHPFWEFDNYVNFKCFNNLKRIICSPGEEFTKVDS